MKRLLEVFGLIVFCVLLVFGLAVWLDIDWLNHPKSYLISLGNWTPIAAIALLALDIVLPIPGSIVMVLMGHLYGALLGAFISFAGMMVSSLLGYGIGRWMIWRNKPTDLDRIRAQKFMDQWGDLALLVSRPIPVLSESVVILAGAQKMAFKKVFVFCALGWLPTAITYALIGAYSFSAASNIWAFMGVIGLTLALFGLKLFSRSWQQREVDHAQ